MPINADQNSGIDTNVDQFRSMPINAEVGREPGKNKQARNADQLIGIDRQ